MGGLAAAIALSNYGYKVRVFDRQATPGGKARLVNVDGAQIDAGPTVLTMRWVFDQLFEEAGTSLTSAVETRTIDILARHAWLQGGRLDLFANLDRSADAIGQLAGKTDANGYREFARDSAEVYRILQSTFICHQQPTMFELVRRIGFANSDVWRLRPYTTYWSTLRRYFSDPRLQQLFGRYATYCGSSPMRSPATLMLVAHVEQQGVWSINGGIFALVQALRNLAEAQGAEFHLGCDVEAILSKSNRVNGVRLSSGEVVDVDAVVFNGDSQALNKMVANGEARAVVKAYRPNNRSLSALTWCIKARTSGFPLDLHNVFFAQDYASEFDAIFKGQTITEMPTIYICAQDRGGFGAVPNNTPERLLIIVNAPANGDLATMSQAERSVLQQRIMSFLANCGLQIAANETNSVMTTPSEFENLFPASGGALYGRATHGPFASFARPGAVTAMSGLYLAGGTVHPGPGMPMAAMSGRLAAARLISDFSD